jgi:hypothetical protein
MVFSVIPYAFYLFSFAEDFAAVAVFASYVVEANLDKSACFLSVVGYSGDKAVVHVFEKLLVQLNIQ